MNQPLVSVVTPMRAPPDGLRETLDSVAAQTLADWEHLVVADGDEDGALALIAARAAEDPRVRQIARHGRCADGSRNVGIKASRAPFIILLGAGDVLASECLERRAAVMSRNADLDFATFQPGVRARAVGETAAGAGPQLIGDDLGRFLFGHAPWMTAGLIWRRETLLQLGLFDETLAGWQDVELAVRAICTGAHYARFAEVDHDVQSACGPGSARGVTSRPPASALEAIERMEAHVRAGPGMSWVRQRALCSLYFYVAESWVERGDLGAGLAAWDQVRKRRLGPAQLHAVGAALLRLRAAGAPSRGLMHEWKRWAKLRAIPELSAGPQTSTQRPMPARWPNRPASSKRGGS
jgi:hypothetical protein